MASLSIIAFRAASFIWLRSELKLEFSFLKAYNSSYNYWLSRAFSFVWLINLKISSSFDLSFSSSYLRDSYWFLYCRTDLYFSSYSSALAVWKSSFVFDYIKWDIPTWLSSLVHATSLAGFTPISSLATIAYRFILLVPLFMNCFTFS